MVQIIKELWSNRKTRAIFLLGVYFIFFMIVIILARQTQTTNHLEYKYQNIQNYEYQITVFNKQQPVITKKGKKYNNKEQYTFNNQEFYVQDHIIYKIIENQMHIYNTQEQIEELLTLLTPLNIEKLIQKSSLNYSTTYKDGTIEKNYSL